MVGDALRRPLLWPGWLAHADLQRHALVHGPLSGTTLGDRHHRRNRLGDNFLLHYRTSMAGAGAEVGGAKKSPCPPARNGTCDIFINVRAGAVFRPLSSKNLLSSFRGY